jgi:hypothetical protein
MERGLAVTTLLAAIAFVLAFACAETPTETLPTPATDSQIAATSSKPCLMGVGSCSASACHGGSAVSKEPWRSAYTVWATQDRHSQAYAALFSPLARQIVNNLDGRKDEPKPYEDKRCLGCHSVETPGKPAEKQFLADGVGCEACHGAAEHWLTAHTERSWNAKTQRLGMTDTKDIVTRASECVKCHVGASSRSDGAARDVNHDLIAAGHPRLAFELNAYLAAMPPHWAANRDEDPVNTWAAGRLVALKASLDLLNARSELAKSAAPAEKRNAPWPEFAELDCFSCHRPMSVSANAKGRLGLPSRNPWYVALVDSILKNTTPPRSFDLAKVDKWVPWNAPDQAVVQTAAANLAEVYGSFQSTSLPTIPTPRLVRSIAETTDTTNWDQAAQAYLALVAVVARERPKQSRSKQAELDELLTNLRRAVQPPRVRDKNGTMYHFDSPRDYSPPKFQAAMDAIIEFLDPDSKSN